MSVRQFVNAAIVPPPAGRSMIRADANCWCPKEWIAAAADRDAALISPSWAIGAAHQGPGSPLTFGGVRHTVDRAVRVGADLLLCHLSTPSKVPPAALLPSDWAKFIDRDGAGIPLISVLSGDGGKNPDGSYLHIQQTVRIQQLQTLNKWDTSKDNPLGVCTFLTMWPAGSPYDPWDSLTVWNESGSTHWLWIGRAVLPFISQKRTSATTNTTRYGEALWRPDLQAAINKVLATTGEKITVADLSKIPEVPVIQAAPIKTYRDVMRGVLAKYAGSRSYWPMQEVNGSTFVNEGIASFGAGSNLTIVGSPTLGVLGPIPGEQSLAARLSGTGQYATGSLATAATNNLTMGLWLRGNSLAGSTSYYAMYNGTPVDLGAANGYGIRWRDGAWDIILQGSTNAVAVVTQTPSAWTFVAIRRNAGQWSLCVNGAVTNATAGTPVIPVSRTDVGAVGGLAPWKGDTAHGFVIDAVISDADLQYLYLAGKNGVGP